MAAAFSLEAEGGIGLLRLRRPEKRNALDAAMIDELNRLCRMIEHDPAIDVLILTGSGGAFCAGGDIAAWGALTPEAFGRHWLRDGHVALDALARLRQPVIAVLNGPALGGGFELAACADYRIAERGIRIGQPEPGLGIIAGWSGTQRAVRRFGAQRVRRMALFGEVLSAERALAAGIVDQVVAPGAGLDAARDVAAGLLKRGRVATELTKMLINAAEGEEVERVLDALAGRAAMAGVEIREGLAAFHEKRPPRFDRS